MLGIDVHPYYQRGLNFAAVKREGRIKFVWVKLSDGGAPYMKIVGKTEYFPAQMTNQARDAGLLVGGYHYAQLSPSPEDQADVFTREVRGLAATDIPPALDLEEPFVPGSEALSFAVRFLRRMLENGFPRVALYASTSMLGSFHVDSYFDERVLIWVANPSGVPGAYKNKYYRGRADVHQYDQLEIPGSGTLVLDLNHVITTLGATVANLDRMQAILESLDEGAVRGLPEGHSNIGVWAAELRQSQANTEHTTAALLEAVTDLYKIVADVVTEVRKLTEGNITLVADGQIVIKPAP